jgi:hypothetical protein
MHIYLVEAEHFEVPGIIRRAFTCRAYAETFANETANQILRDASEIIEADFAPLPLDATPAQRKVAIHEMLAKLEDGFGDAYANVTELELEGPLPL